MEKKTIGIIGGMGPLATADLFEKIVGHTKAACDQEHLHVVIDSNTNIPDRTAALLHGGADPLPELVKSAGRLEKMGADVLIMPCNTAHNYYDGIAAAVSVPVLHMVRLTDGDLSEELRGIRCGAADAGRGGTAGRDGDDLSGGQGWRHGLRRPAGPAGYGAAAGRRGGGFDPGLYGAAPGGEAVRDRSAGGGPHLGAGFGGHPVRRGRDSLTISNHRQRAQGRKKES